MNEYGSGSGRYLAKCLRDLSDEAQRLAAFAEALPVEKSAGELEHEEAMRAWEARGGMRFGPPPIARPGDPC